MMSYRYKRPDIWDGPFARAIIERDVGVPPLGIRETPRDVTIFFERELTPDQKSKLDSIMKKPPLPIRYEFGAVELEDEIEKVVGKRPVRVDYDPATGRAVIDFEEELTPAEEKALEGYFKARHLGRLLRRGF